ncbi:hypothetical protein ES707_18552 [subsurface metagenome]|jgi:hypothetical protein
MSGDNKEAEQTYAYTPGLKIKESMAVSKFRRLPIPGEVLVKMGDEIRPDTIVAETLLPGDPVIVPAMMKLGITPEGLPSCMLVNVGDHVNEGEILARYSMFFGLINRELPSPISGTVEVVSELTGQLIMRGKDIPVRVDAYIPGKVIEVVPEEGVVVETTGAFIQGIFGIGGERQGKLRVAVEGPGSPLTSELFSSEDKGKVIIGGGLLTLDALRKAVDLGVSGIIVGGIDSGDLMEFMGAGIGVAITGEEEYGITLIITEGFGDMAMHNKTFSIFKKYDGSDVSINGSTQIRAGVIRPEVVIPHSESIEEADDDTAISAGMVPGTPIRIIRNPYFGAIGEVLSLPVELQVVETGSKVRVLEALLEDGRTVIVPRANVEIIEE